MGILITDFKKNSLNTPKMASSLMRRCAFTQFRRIHTATPCLEKAKEPEKGWKMMDYKDHIMGKERAIYEAQKAGITDPYLEEPTEINRNSTKDNPNIVYSVNYKRTVTCICDHSPPNRDCTLTPPTKKQWAALTWRHSMPRVAPSAPFTGLPLVRTVGWPRGKLRTAPLSRATTQGANLTCRTRVDLYTNYRHLIL